MLLSLALALATSFWETDHPNQPRSPGTLVAGEVGFSGIMGAVFPAIYINAFLYFTLFFVVYCVFRTLRQKRADLWGNRLPFAKITMEITCLVLSSMALALLTFAWVTAERTGFRTLGGIVADQVSWREPNRPQFTETGKRVAFTVGFDALVYFLLLFGAYLSFQRFSQKKTAGAGKKPADGRTPR